MTPHADEHTPRDDFPPHGYLDNPWHSWKLNPSGVLRSRLPAGMGWHVPNYGSYARNQFSYRAHLHVGLEANGTRLLTPDDFRRAKVTVGCDLHTKNRLRFTWAQPPVGDPATGARLAATYFLAGEHALACRIALEPPEGATQPLIVRLWLAQEVAHNPATSRLWEHGLYSVLPGADEPEVGACGLLGVAPEGDAWAHGLAADSAPLLPVAARHETTPWLRDKFPSAREPAELQTATLLLGYDVTLPPGAPRVFDAVLARGVGPDAALRAWHDAQAAFDAALAERTADDERFWSRAPRLAGDWPAHWRRGMATDFETLRMVVRPPAGVFARPWDGMQIQAPRSVLAETALDALALAWADPAAAQDLILSCFAAAPRPNVPCMREDGSYNMVADDGAICGTGPEWGWPFVVIYDLFGRTHDREWLTVLYPHLAAYLDWWLTRRVDAEGWPVHACSWESGQDISTRFGAQSSGGSDVRHIRPVDLQAAVAGACDLLAEWAGFLDQPAAEVERWQAHADDHMRRVRAMWRDGWYHDYDTRTGRWSGVRDPMQLAPLIHVVGTDEDGELLCPTFDELPLHCGVYPPLVWPPVAFTVLEAAASAGLNEWTSERTAEILERAWRRMDARDPEPDGALPGVTREYWPEGGRGVSAGIEGYGWGALTIHFLIRHRVGLREVSTKQLTLCPALPVFLRRPGASYTVGPIAYGRGALTVTYTLAPAPPLDWVDVSVVLDGPWKAAWAYESGPADPLARSERDAQGLLRLAWAGRWLQQVYIGLDSESGT
jgi:hypothetical protein